MNQAGVHFTSSTAWNFFLKLVMKFTILYSQNTICSGRIIIVRMIMLSPLLYLLPFLLYRNICQNMRVVVTSASCDAKFQRNFKSNVSLCNRLNTVYCLEWSRMELVDVAIHHLKGHPQQSQLLHYNV